MRRKPAGGMGLAWVAAVAVHLAMLALLALGARPPSLRLYGDDSFEVALIAPLYLPRRAKISPPTPPARRPPRAVGATIAQRPMGPVESPTAPSAAHLATTQAQDGDLGAALRSKLGCARTGLSQEERLACADALGRGVRQVAALGQTVPAEKQAYYDAVKAARQSEGHGPGVGCHIRFGGGEPASVEVPAHGLKLGPLPCYLVPPAGMLSPEADLPNPH